MLEAVAGEPEADRWWWQRLAGRHAIAVTTADDDLLGAVRGHGILTGGGQQISPLADMRSHR